MSSAKQSATASLLRDKSYGDLGFAGLVVAIVALLIVPLPTFALDVLLTANISLAVVLLLTSIYVKRPLSLSTFPSILLVATLFRLALNVSTTRLILSQADAGDVVASFGQFVVRGNYVVGAVIFLILTIIQFLVIAKGSERVAEVAARFTLDAMPGKQMAIDADLRAGAYSLKEAQRRRAELQAESKLFGAMDGAMKFVKGDAIAGIIITIINIVGGLVIGMVQRDMSAGDAASVYTLLTIGDGLVSQIPALLVSVCAGIIVTRVHTSEEDSTDLGTEIIAQLSATPRVFGIAAALLTGLAVIPGLPLVPFLALAAISAGLAAVLSRSQSAAAAHRAEVEALESGAGRRSQDLLVQAVTPITIELGSTLSAAIRDGAGEAELRDEVQHGRAVLFQRLGVRLPSVRIRFDVATVGPNQLRIQVYEVPELTVTLSAEHALVLANAQSAADAGITGESSVNPLNGGPALKVSAADADKADEAGLPVARLSRQVMLHVSAAAQRRAADLVGLAEVQAALDQLEPTHGALIDAVTPRPVSLAKLTGVLRRLVEEGVSIRDLRGILEPLAARAGEEADVVELTELAREGLGRAIAASYSKSGAIYAWMVAGAVEATVRDSIRRDGGKPALAMPPRVTSEVLGAFRKAWPNPDARYVLAVSQDVRRFMRQLVALEYPNVVVLGFAELQDAAVLQSLGTIDVGG